MNLETGLKGRTYEEILLELCITSLLERRVKTDMIQTFKIINRVDNVDSRAWFTLVGPTTNMRTRNTNCEKNIVGRTRTGIRKNLIFQQSSGNVERTANRSENE